MLTGPMWDLSTSMVWTEWPLLLVRWVSRAPKSMQTVHVLSQYHLQQEERRHLWRKLDVWHFLHVSSQSKHCPHSSHSGRDLACECLPFPSQRPLSYPGSYWASRSFNSLKDCDHHALSCFLKPRHVAVLRLLYVRVCCVLSFMRKNLFPTTTTGKHPVERGVYGLSSYQHTVGKYA